MVVTSSNTKLHATRNDIPEDIRAQVVELLNQTLATVLDLKTQAKQAHWNVKGMNFLQLHELFDTLATELEAFVDLVAERVTTLGGVAMGTARVASRESILAEYDLNAVSGKEHVSLLADRYGVFARHLREAIALTDQLGDADSSDLYTEISRAIDMRLWFLEAHLG